MVINKLSNAQGSTKSLQKSYSAEIMDRNKDCIVASLNLEVITTWNYLAVRKQMISVNFIIVTYKPST